MDTQPNEKPIGQQIKEALDRKGHTQDWLAEMCDVSNNAVSKWIKTGKVSKENIAKLCMYTGIDPAIFLGAPVRTPVADVADSSLGVAQYLRRTVAAIAREWGVDLADLADPSEEALERIQRAIEQARARKPGGRENLKDAKSSRPAVFRQGKSSRGKGEPQP